MNILNLSFIIKTSVTQPFFSFLCYKLNIYRENQSSERWRRRRRSGREDAEWEGSGRLKMG